jgi:plastocyanin
MKDDVKVSILAILSTAAIIMAAITITTPVLANTESSYAGVKKEFWLFNSGIYGFNETMTGMPHDVFSMPIIAVTRGDRVIIHFFNTESPKGDHHTFTILDEPYKMNVEVSPGENKTITFTADTIGTFTFLCNFHQPTMRGQLVVEFPQKS